MKRVEQLTVDKSVTPNSRYLTVPGIYQAEWCGYRLQILSRHLTQREKDLATVGEFDLQDKILLSLSIEQGIRGRAFIEIEITPEGEVYEIEYESNNNIHKQVK